MVVILVKRSLLAGTNRKVVEGKETPTGAVGIKAVRDGK